VLIWLAKAGALDHLRQQYQTILIPPEVKTEVIDQGLHEGHPDAHVIKKAVEDGWIKIEDAPTKPREGITRDLPEIHEGEAAAMALALKRRLPLLIDESCGRITATALGLHPRGSIHVILRALNEKRMTTHEARQKIAFMVTSGLRIEPKLLERLLREITQPPNHHHDEKTP